MNQRPIRFRGTEYPVIERIRVNGHLYLAIAKLGAAGRRAYQVFDTSAKEMRALHILDQSKAMEERLRTLQRATRGDNGILQILAVERQDKKLWIVLPWVDGFNLRTVLTGIRTQGKQRIAAPEALRLTKGVAHALRHLYVRRGVNHGDVKPANLILTKRTSLVLIDYGNAWMAGRTTSHREKDGVSRVYSAPEVQCGERVDRRADYFSLGVVLYELLTDHIPYDGQGGNIGMLPDSVKSGLQLVPASRLSPEREKISKRIWNPIDELLSHSLAIDADDRFETPSAWLDAWKEAMTAIQQTPRGSKLPPALPRWLDWIANKFK